MIFWSEARSFPWRRTRSPYRVLLGELLLQRTRGENVVPVYHAALEKWPTVYDLAKARTSSIAKILRPLGLAKRAPLITALARTVVTEFHGRIPNNIQDLQRLPGVGPYSSHAVQVFARGEDLPLVDWVIARVLRRYFGLSGMTRPNADKELWILAGDIAKQGKARATWLGTLDFAAIVCAPRPRCPTCALRTSCAYFGNTQSRT
jgi:A/G-specific adenine glycosylase